MPVYLDRVAAALNAYPWTPGTLTRRADGTPRYCAVGALLRYAGVAEDHIACVSGTAGSHDLWHPYGALLTAEYGIANARVARLVMAANDERQRRLAGGGHRAGARGGFGRAGPRRCHVPRRRGRRSGGGGARAGQGGRVGPGARRRCGLPRTRDLSARLTTAPKPPNEALQSTGAPGGASMCAPPGRALASAPE